MCVQCIIRVHKTAHGMHTMASIVKLPSGSWRAQVMRGGVRHGMTFKKHADAKKWAADQESKLESIRAVGTASTPKGSTFADFVDKYVEETEPVKKHGKNKKSTLKRLKNEFKGVLMSDFSILHLRDFVERRVKEKTQAGVSVSGVTIAIDLSYISVVLKWARVVKHYDVDVSIVQRAREMLEPMGLSTKSNERKREASKDELITIFAAYQKKLRQKIPMEDIITFALASAMRQEEICSLEISDVDFDEKSIVIKNRKDPKQKSGNDMLVPLLGRAWELAEKYIGDRKSGRIFPYNSGSVSASFTRVCQECEIQDLRFHDLRHTATGLLFEIGLHIEQVAVLTGHKDWKMLKRYTHIKAKNVHASYEENMQRRKKREETLEIIT